MEFTDERQKEKEKLRTRLEAAHMKRKDKKRKEKKTLTMLLMKMVGLWKMALEEVWTPRPSALLFLDCPLSLSKGSFWVKCVFKQANVFKPRGAEAHMHRRKRT